MGKVISYKNAFHSILTSAYLGIGAACALVFVIGRMGMMHEMETIRTAVIRAQVSEVKSNADRTVLHLEQDLLRARNSTLADVASNSGWLRDLWTRTKEIEPIRAFRAIVDVDGRIVAHTEQSKVGGIVAANPKYHRDDKQSENLVERSDVALAGNNSYIEINLPIRRFRKLLGHYACGISSEWIARKIAAEQTNAWWTWTIVIASAISIVAITGVVLYRLARRATWLERELHVAEGRRLSELSMLMVGMAHEVRNPLNSIRLNLHTSERVFLGGSKLDDNEVLSMLSESVREVERVNELVSQLLGFARSERDNDASVEAVNEIESAIQFFRTTLEQMHIEIKFRNDAVNTWLPMDRSRLRQILLNLLTNARDALPNGGAIEVSLDNSGNRVRMVVADSGGGVEETMRQRIFEPFVTTRKNGTGLGLAVVRSMLESVGGTIHCHRSTRLGGAEFVLNLPMGSSASLTVDGS
ncbi:MAG: ATP-binding protein [Pirellula sp.]